MQSLNESEILVTPSGMSTDFSFGQSQNKQPDNSVKELESFTDSRLLQWRNTPLQRVVTELGIIIVSIPESINAISPIVSRVSGSIISFRLLQYANT